MNEKPPTTLSHGALPYPVGTLVEDTISERTGHLVGVVEERLKEGGRVVSRQAFMRPQGGVLSGMCRSTVFDLWGQPHDDI